MLAGVLAVFGAEHVGGQPICRVILYKLCHAVFVCWPLVSLGEGQRKENSGKQSRAGGAESKQTSPQLPSLTSAPFFDIRLLIKAASSFWGNGSRFLILPVAQQSRK